MIGVTGATGFVGGHTARYVAERDAPLRLIVRDPTRAPDLGAEVRAASSYGAGDEMRAALEGVDTLFLVPAEESADRIDQHRTAVDAAVAAGVGRIVYLSFVAAASDTHVHARPRPLGDRGAHPRRRRAVHVPAHEPVPRLPAAHGGGRRHRRPGG